MKTAASIVIALAAACVLPGADPAPAPAGPAGTRMAPPLPGAESGVPLSKDLVISAVRDELYRHFSLEGDLQVEFLRPVSTPERLAQVWSVQVAEYPSVVSNAMLLRCRILADGAVVLEPTLMLRASLWRDVWVARQPAQIGTPFDPAVLDTRRVDVFRERDAMPAASADAAFIYACNVQPGHVLTWRDIARRPLVKKGAMVEVSASDGQLSLTMKALAMQSGAKGEAVTVRNVESRKDFTAFVVDENRVQVRF